jgi:biotin synthase
MADIHSILAKQEFELDDLVTLLAATGDDRKALFEAAARTKAEQVGNMVYLRGLIEFSNVCRKNCLYCGIRLDNKEVERYTLSDEQVVAAARLALDSRYGSIVIQGGEITSPAFTLRIENLLHEIKALSGGKLGITLSLGEQSEDTYQRWFDAGAHRYLLRIESSTKSLYSRIHPNDENHVYEDRLEALRLLKKVGFQVGTGVMIGLPHQTLEDLARDLMFFKELDIDMCGMGPYIEHQQTPLYAERGCLMPLQDRFDLALKMIATLRVYMKDINIAAATALQAIDKIGREKAIKVGANIIMPNITPGVYRDSYKLYENKPCTDESAEECTSCLDARITLTGDQIGYEQWGDSQHFGKKQK